MLREGKPLVQDAHADCQDDGRARDEESALHRVLRQGDGVPDARRLGQGYRGQHEGVRRESLHKFQSPRYLSSQQRKDRMHAFNVYNVVWFGSRT